jgi:PAS domain S-box-containing protein
LPLAAASHTENSPVSKRGKQPVFIVDDDLKQAEQVQLALTDAGYQTELFFDQQSFSERIEQVADGPPMAVVMDLVFPDDDSGGLELLAKYKSVFSEHHIPVVVLSVRDDMMARLQAFRAGASRYLSKPVDTATLVDLLDTLTGRRPVEPYRVLLVDDDALVRQAHASVLTAAGMSVLCVEDPLNILEALNGFDPDVAIIDVYMPGVSGPELAAVLRERFAYLHMPIIFLSAESDLGRQLMALNLGGDDFLVKPVLPEHLVAAVSARARRARQASAIRTRLETTLYEREREHVALNQHAIVSIADGRGDIIYVNDRFCEIAGYARHELLGVNHRLIKSGLHDAAFYGDMWRTIKQGEVWQGEICNRKKDGSLYWVSSTITPFLDVDGKPYQYVSIRTDITDVKSRELEQKRQSDLKQLIAEVGAALMDAPANAMDQAVVQALALTGRFLGAERANLFQYQSLKGTVTNTHEWHEKGLNSQKAMITDVPIADLPWWWDVVQNGAVIYLPDVNALPEEAASEKAFFKSLAIRSVVGFPIIRDGKVSGLLGFASLCDPYAWHEQDLKLLQIIAELISSALKRCEAEQRAESHKEMLRIGQVFANIGTWDWDVKTDQLYWTERIA